MTDTDVPVPGANLAAALAKFQAECPPVEKNKVGKVEGTTKQGKSYSYEYRYADLAAINKVALPVLGRCGLSWSCKPTLINDGTGRRFALVYTLRHASGETDCGEWPLHENQGPQGLASEISYARRYTFCSMTGIAAEDDDDGSRAEEAAAQEPSRGRRQQQQRRRQEESPEQPAPPSPSGPASVIPGSATTAQIGAIWTALSTAYAFGKDEKEPARQACAHIIGHPLGSTKDMSRKEASTVIETLKDWEKLAADQGMTPRELLTQMLVDAAGRGEPGA